MSSKYNQKTVGKSTMKLRDILKAEGKMDEVDKLRNLLKAKYISRKRGKDGKYEYEYAKDKKDRGKGKEEKKEVSPIGQIKKWNEEDVSELRDMLNNLSNEDKEAIDMADLPSANIPDDIDTSYPVWAVDKKGRALVGDTADKIEFVSEIREYQQESKKTMNKAALIDPWRLTLMKLDNRRG